MKSVEKIKAIELRKSGMSIKEIAKTLGISSGTSSLWLRNIELTEEQKQVLRAKNPIYNDHHMASKMRAHCARERRLKYREEGKIMARKNEFLHSFVCALYWGEGSKSDQTCGISNTDPNLLKMFLRFLKTYFPNEKITVRVQCFTNNGLSVNDIEQYWSDTLDIPRASFRKGTINIVSKASKNKRPTNILPYGTLTVKVYSVKVLQHIFGAIEEYSSYASTMGLY
jgi:transposase-like protein